MFKSADPLGFTAWIQLPLKCTSRDTAHRNYAESTFRRVQRQVPIVFCARSRDQPLRHLLLQHEYGALAIRIGDYATQDRRAGVVGKISDCAKWFDGQRHFKSVIIDDIERRESCTKRSG